MGNIHNFKKFKFKPFKMRIGNIAVTNFYEEDGKKKSVQGHLKRPKFSFFEIVKFEKNQFFGKEYEYEMAHDPDYYRQKNGFGLIHKSCFKNPETMYMIASWDNIDHDELTPDLRFVGNRVFDLNSEEQLIFMQLAKIGQEEIQRQLEKNLEDVEY